MQTNCLYCLETFNYSDKKPFKLECNHVYCGSCVNLLKLYIFPQICPIDNIKVNFLCLELCENILIHLNSICSLHSLEITVLCKDHQILLCSVCAKTHSECPKVEGKYDQLQNNISETIRKSKNKAHQISLDFNHFSNYIYKDDLNWLLDDCKKSISKYQLMLEADIPKDLNINENPNDIRTSCKDILQLIDSNCKKSTSLVSYDKILSTFTEKQRNQAFLNLVVDGEAAFDEKFLIGCCKAYNELKIIRKLHNSMKFFKVALIHKKTEKAFISYFMNSEKSAWIVYGVGIGRPADESGYVYVRELSVSFENKTQKYNDFSIEYDSQSITSLFYLNESILLPSSSSIYIYIDISGNNHNMFCIPVLDDQVKPLNEFQEIYANDFPILHLLVLILG